MSTAISQGTHTKLHFARKAHYTQNILNRLAEGEHMERLHDDAHMGVHLKTILTNY